MACNLREAGNARIAGAGRGRLTVLFFTTGKKVTKYYIYIYMYIYLEQHASRQTPHRDGKQLVALRGNNRARSRTRHADRQKLQDSDRFNVIG